MKQLPLAYKIANTLRNFSIGLLHKGLDMSSSKCDRIVSSRSIFPAFDKLGFMLLDVSAQGASTSNPILKRSTNRPFSYTIGVSFWSLHGIQSVHPFV